MHQHLRQMKNYVPSQLWATKDNLRDKYACQCHAVKGERWPQGAKSLYHLRSAALIMHQALTSRVWDLCKALAFSTWDIMKGLTLTLTFSAWDIMQKALT